jgi:hypothetical protein
MMLIFCIIFGIICAAIASGKGRSGVAWFFIGALIGLIGLIIILCLPNLKQEQARQVYIEQENRRLREQIRQEQIKAEAFRNHAQRRLDVHDQHMGLDTRADDRLLENTAPATGLLGSDDVAAASGSASAPEARSDAPGWYYAIDGQTFGPVPSPGLAEMLRVNAIPKNVMVWTAGMADWTSIERVPELNALVNS